MGMGHCPETVRHRGRRPADGCTTGPDTTGHDLFAGDSSAQIMTAFAAIPADSVTARTAGALRVQGPPISIADERAAFERGVVDENA